MDQPQSQLLEKTELRIERLALDGANLTDVAAVVADTLEIGHDDVIVIDARDDLLALDIHRETLDPYAVVGKQAALFAALDQLPGLEITDRTTLASEGMLGWIAADAEAGRAALDRSRQMVDDIQRTLASRAIVFPTGPEVANGQIRDTNTPFLVAELTAAGFSVTSGAALPDDADHIADTLAEAIEDRGFSLVITTGGVGAEDKDSTVEAVLRIDPDAATPYICQFEAGTGRHHKDGVRIGVSQRPGALVVALPGPHDEVRLGSAALLAGLDAGLAKEDLAEHIAQSLRDRLRNKSGPRH